ncbi:hypothetical protein MKL26_00275 [Streptococcus suis]|nr:hypothetical protein [Streptococcus suis]
MDSQIDTALGFATEVRKRYPQATISTTGHSLGGYLGQIVAIKNKWSSTTFNAPNPANMLTKEEIAWARANTDILISYRNEKDKIGNFGGDTLGIVRSIASYQEDEIAGLDALYHHGLSTWQFDKNGNLIDKYGLVVDKKTSKIQVDVDGDGVVDIILDRRNLEPRNLFLSTGTINTSGSKSIKIDPNSLRILSGNLMFLATNEIPSLIRLCQLCQEKNNKIQNNFEMRKQKVEESILERFKATRLTEVFYRLHDSVGQLIQNNHLFQELSSPGQVVDTIPEPTYLSSGSYLELSPYNIQLSNLGSKRQTIFQNLTSETSSVQSVFGGINPTPTILKSVMILEETAKKLKEKSNSIFKGKGLRESKKDAISQSLDEVLKVEEKNLAALQKALESVSRLTLSLARNFEAMDQWLHIQLSNGGTLEGMTVQSIPTSYRAYLEESHIFDDVKDVLQAFDAQVEENSRLYANEVATAYTHAFSEVQTSLEKWIREIDSFNKTISATIETFTIDIYIDKKKKIDDEWITTRQYWGPLSRLYRSSTVSTIRAAETTLPPIVNRIVSAIEIIRTATNDMQNLKPSLKKIVEEGVYSSFELDEIVSSQHAVQSITGRIHQELNYAIQVITQQMSGEAVSTLVTQLDRTRQLTAYFNQLVENCFGEQAKIVADQIGNIGEFTINFSLNN